MSRPTAISPEEQEQIARRIGVLLLQAAPEEWQQITVEYRATGEYHDLLGEVTSQQGDGEPWEPPEELLGIFEHLREGMYRPDVGTWLSALYIVEKPSSYRIDINFDTEPRWRRPLPRAAYVDELRRYPRADENVPDWLREKLHGSGSPGAAPADGAPVPADQTDGAFENAAMADGGDVANSERFAGEPSTGTPHFETAIVFDDFDEHGRPLVASRAPVHPDELAALSQYLENAPIVLASRDNEPDQLDSERPNAIPGTWHTDGVWLWQGAVPYYLAQYGVPPQAELVERIRAQRYALAEIDDQTRDAATRELFERAQNQASSAAEARSSAPQEAEYAHRGEDFAEHTPVGDVESARMPDSGADEPEAYSSGSAAPAVGATAAGAAAVGAAAVGASAMGASAYDSNRGDAADDYADEPDDGAANADAFEADSGDKSLPEGDNVLAQLHDKLTEYEVDNRDYRIGSHSPNARCLLQEGPDWIVTAGPHDPAGEDVRFSSQEQAAAYLLGSLLLAGSDSSPAPPPQLPVRDTDVHENAVEEPSAEPAVEAIEQSAPPLLPQRPRPDVAAPVEPPADVPQEAPALAQREPVQEEAETAPRGPAEPEPPRRSESGGHFLFTANQGGPEGATPESEPTVRRDAPAAELGAPTGEEATRFQQAPRLDRPGPQSPPGAPQAQDPRNGAPAGPGQAPQSLPKRPQRLDQGGHAGPPGGPDQNGRPPAGAPVQPGPAGERRPGPGGPGAAGPPRQGPPNGAPMNRPPQGAQPQAGQPQGAQPQGGQPQGAQPQGGQPQGGQPQGAQPQGGQPQPGQPPAQQPGAPGGAQQQAGPQQNSGQPQPFRGEPPLTLYRDRRNVMLQPGTDLDRFGDPSGNVAYAVRTPFTQRSLPPQWASRPYTAYRVQRPVQVLRGTAVPWFEQPGGGTAYVLPASLSDLLADGTLHELTGNEAPPRPTME